jgi:hypothetical protein
VIGERDGDASWGNGGVVELDQRAGTGARRHAGADREPVRAVTIDDHGVVGAGTNGEASAGMGAHGDRVTAAGVIVDEVGLWVVRDDHLDLCGERAGKAQQLAFDRRCRIDRDRAARRDVDLEQPGDRLIQGVEGGVRRDLLLRLALEDVGDGKMGRGHRVALASKPRPTLSW